MRLILKKILNKTFISLFIFFTVVTAANSGEMYICVDDNGNTVVTSIPQDGMKNCVLKDSYHDPSVKESKTENKNAAVEEDKQAEEKENKESEKRIENCINCCSEKQAVCYNYTANGRLCASGKQSCIETCNSEGATSSSWSECWSQTEKQENMNE